MTGLRPQNCCNFRVRLERRSGGLLGGNLEPLPADLLWRQYVQLTEVEEAFRVLKSELNLRPVWHRTGPRVEAHVMVAFLGYCLWVCLKHKLRAAAPSLTPARVLEVLGGMMMVEVWFRLRDGRNLCLPRYTQPETEQAFILHLLGWTYWCSWRRILGDFANWVGPRSVVRIGAAPPMRMAGSICAMGRN